MSGLSKHLSIHPSDITCTKHIFFLPLVQSDSYFIHWVSFDERCTVILNPGEGYNNQLFENSLSKYSLPSLYMTPTLLKRAAQ